MDDDGCRRPVEHKAEPVGGGAVEADAVAIRHELVRSRERRKARAAARTARRIEFSAMIAAEGLGVEEKEAASVAFLEHERILARASRRRMDTTDFEVLSVIGRGSYGEVSLVREKETGELFAMKRMAKAQWAHKNPSAISARIRREREALVSMTASDFILKLHYSFQDALNVYLVSDFATGGDLMGTLIHEGLLPERCVQYIAVELVEALDTVHRAGYVHRDVKPDNILIDAEGHVMLSDMGLARRVDPGVGEGEGEEGSFTRGEGSAGGGGVAARGGARDRRALLRSRVGTLDYLAPEVLAGKPYAKEVDFWSLGAVLFECMLGYAPFHGSDGVSTRDKLAHFRHYLRFPPSRCGHLSPEALHFVSALLTSQTERLGFGRGVAELREHPWFREVDWPAVRARSFGGPLVLDPSILDARMALRTMNARHPHMAATLRRFLSPFADFLRSRLATPAVRPIRAESLDRPIRIYAFTFKRHDPALDPTSDVVRAIVTAASHCAAADAAASTLDADE